MVTITFETTTDAFWDYPLEETASILRLLAAKVAHQNPENRDHPINDVNGNIIGKMTLDIERNRS